MGSSLGVSSGAGGGLSMGLVDVGRLLADELEDLDLDVAELVSGRTVVLLLPVKEQNKKSMWTLFPT